MDDREKACGFDGCDRKSYAKKLCVQHYRQQLSGKELAPIRPYVRGGAKGKCGFESCGRNQLCRGLCEQHNKQRRRGEALRPIRTYTRD